MIHKLPILTVVSLLCTLASPLALAGAPESLSLVVEFDHALSAKELLHYASLPGLKKAEKFTPYSSAYFDRVYELTSRNARSRDALAQILAHDLLVRNVEQPHPFTLSAVGESLNPGSKSKLPWNDPFLNFQWALSATDQQAVRPVNDLDTTRVSVNSRNPPDIGLDPSVDVDSLMKKTVVVAVIDTGVDYAHEDLQANIFKNTAECENGLPPVVGKTDNDNNGFIGDCNGWDFTAADPRNANKPVDDLGHGTHISGIMAAIKGNGVGIAGVSNKIKILPLKVMSATVESSNAVTAFQKMGLTDKVAKAILYAVKMKVDVINLSMGWPLLFDSQYLRQAFDEAKKANITVVAAAGNNNTYSTVLPCSYDGVICVAATGIDDKLANFSNYGGQVEISAPGEQILSTYPKAVDTYDFDFKGYEILNGTSQAAPYVSAAAAVLKGIYPGISEDEVKARLFAGSAPLLASDDKHIEFGTLKLMAAANLKPQPVIAPVFKSLERIVYLGKSNFFRFALPVKNYWAATSGVEVGVRALTPQIQLTDGASFSGDFADSESKTMTISGTLADPSASSNARLEVTVRVPGQGDKVYVQDLLISRSVVGDPLNVKYPVKLIDSTVDISTQLKTVPEFFGVTHSPEYFWIDSAKGSATLHMLQLKNGAFQESKKTFSGVDSLNAVVRIPNGPNSWQYCLEFVQSSSPSVKIRFDVYPQDLSARKATFTYLVKDTESDVLTKILSPSFLLSNAALIPFSAANSFAFVAAGPVPKDDQNPDFFSFENTKDPSARLFFFQPLAAAKGAAEFRLRNYDNFKFTASLRAKLNLTYSDDLVLVSLLPQPFGEKRLRVLYAYGSGDDRKLAVVSARSDQMLSHDYTLEPLGVSSSMLSLGNMSKVMDISGAEARSNVGAAFAEKITDSTGLMQFLLDNKKGSLLSNPVKTSTPLDLIVAFRQAFQDGQHLYSFIETKDNIMLQVNDLASGHLTGFETSIHRTSVTEALPVVFSESFNTTTYRLNGKLYAAMFVDASQLFSSHFYITYADPVKGLVSPAEMDLEIPGNCSMLNPAKFNPQGDFAFIMLCKSPANWEIDALPMAK